MRRALLLLLCLAASPARAAAPPSAPDDILHMISCPDKAAEYVATLHDTLLLEKEFLGGPALEDEAIRESIRHQLRFFWGYLRTHGETHKEQLLVLAAEEPEIEILQKKEVPYGSDLVLDWKETAPELQITDAYTSRAVKRGFTKKEDAAYAVEFEVRFRVALCGKARPEKSSTTTPLPSDPWLMHWRVPASERRVLRYFEEAAFTNPCNDDDYADLPHPFYHWYDWYPERHGPDAEGKAFDCRPLLKEGRDLHSRRIELRQVATPHPDFRTLAARLGDGGAREIRATVLIGVLDHTFKTTDYTEPAALLGSGKGDLPAKARALMAKQVVPATERASERFLQLLIDLERLADLGDYSAKKEGGFLAVEVSGRLKRSGRALRLRAYVGLTDIFGPTPPEHWDILRRGLSGDDLIIYAGHSGIGENFRLANIEQNLKLSHEAFAEEFRRAPFQLIAFLSCYSYMYFGRDLEAAARQGGGAAGREFVYTGTPFTKPDQGTLALLDLVDQVLAPKRAGAPSLHFLEPGDFLILKEARPAEAR